MRFKVGDLAIFAVASDPSGISGIGQTIEIKEVGPFHQGERFRSLDKTVGHDCDYLIQCPDKNIGIVWDWQLRKINPPEEPRTMTHHEETTA